MLSFSGIGMEFVNKDYCGGYSSRLRIPVGCTISLMLASSWPKENCNDQIISLHWVKPYAGLELCHDFSSDLPVTYLNILRVQ